MGKTRRKEVRVRVEGKLRENPDARRILRAIIRNSMGTEEMTDRLVDLAHEEREIARRRKAATQAENPEDEAS